MTTGTGVPQLDSRRGHTLGEYGRTTHRMALKTVTGKKCGLGEGRNFCTRSRRTLLVTGVE